jgi:hypothetical protein
MFFDQFCTLLLRLISIPKVSTFKIRIVFEAVPKESVPADVPSQIRPIAKVDKDAASGVVLRIKESSRLKEHALPGVAKVLALHSCM